MNNGYFSISRSLHRSQPWKKLNWKFKEVFTTLLDYAVFYEQPFDDHGHIIHLKPGQFCGSHSELLKLVDNPKIKLIDIQRALTRLQLLDFCRYEVMYFKTVITITEPSICEIINRKHDVENDVKVMQERCKSDVQSNNEYNEYTYIKEKILKKENTEKTAIHIIPETASDNIYNGTEKSIYKDKDSGKRRGKKKFIKANFKDIVDFPPHVWFPKAEYEKLQKEIKPVDFEYLIKEINQGVDDGKYKYSDFSNAIRKWHSNGIIWKNLPSFSNLNTFESDRAFAQRICHEYESEYYELFSDEMKLTIVHKVAQGKPIEIKFGNNFKDQCQKQIIDRKFIKKQEKYEKEAKKI